MATVKDFFLKSSTSSSSSTWQGSFFTLWLFLHMWPHTPQAFLETSRQATFFQREGQPPHRKLRALLFSNSV